jgi:hypothetical protein
MHAGWTIANCLHPNKTALMYLHRDKPRSPPCLPPLIALPWPDGLRRPVLLRRHNQPIEGRAVWREHCPPPLLGPAERRSRSSLPSFSQATTWGVQVNPMIDWSIYILALRGTWLIPRTAPKTWVYHSADRALRGYKGFFSAWGPHVGGMHKDGNRRCALVDRTVLILEGNVN